VPWLLELKMKDQTPPQQISCVVSQVMERLSGGKMRPDRDITGILDTVFKAQEKKYLKISGLKNGTLYFITDSPARVYQFNLRRGIILRAIQKEFPDIQKIYFKTGKVV